MRDWISFKRLVPLGTALFAVGAEVAHHFGLVKNLDVDAVVLFVLALLAFDALVERVGVVENIDKRLARLEAPPVLRDRSKLVNLEELALGVHELAACGPTLVSLLYQRYEYFLKKLDDGMKLRFVVLDPRSEAWKIWNDVEVEQRSPEDTNISLRTLAALMKHQTKGTIEVRLANFVLPSSLLIGDPSRDSGRMNVEFAFSGLSLPSRPHIHLTKAGSPEWFVFFVDRFEYIWNRSTPYTP